MSSALTHAPSGDEDGDRQDRPGHDEGTGDPERRHQDGRQDTADRGHRGHLALEDAQRAGPDVVRG